MNPISGTIGWADFSWNPITGCTPTSDGCLHCYAKTMAYRQAGRNGYPRQQPFSLTFHPDRLDEPQKKKETKRIFVCSMSDFFHPEIPHKWHTDVLHACCRAPQHHYVFLTKRTKAFALAGGHKYWLGITTENMYAAHHRWNVLKSAKKSGLAKGLFISAEPLLNKITIPPEVHLDWIIAGPETGPRKRPFEWIWVNDLFNQSRARGIPFFWKGEKGSYPKEFPEGY